MLFLTTSSILASLATLSASTSIPVSNTLRSKYGVPLESFVAFSIEFSSFPDFAGNLSTPNTFSDNLLNNLGNLSGTKPYIRGYITAAFAFYINRSSKSLYDLHRAYDAT